MLAQRRVQRRIGATLLGQRGIALAFGMFEQGDEGLGHRWTSVGVQTRVIWRSIATLSRSCARAWVSCCSSAIIAIYADLGETLSGHDIPPLRQALASFSERRKRTPRPFELQQLLAGVRRHQSQLSPQTLQEVV